MRSERRNRSAASVAALVLLAAARWALFSLELDPGINTPLYIAESALILLVCALCVFRAPKTASFSCLVLGCAAVGAAYGRVYGFEARNTLLCLVFAAPLLLLVDRCPAGSLLSEKPSRLARFGVGSALCLALAALAASSTGGPSRKLENPFGYCAVLFALTAAPLALVFVLSAVRRGKEGDIFGDGAYALAAAAALLSGIFLVKEGRLVPAMNVPLLWWAVLILLAGAGDPALLRAGGLFGKAARRFAGTGD